MERSEEILNGWGAILSANPDEFSEVSGTVKVVVSGVGEWRFKFGETPSFVKGEGKADCSIFLTPSILDKLCRPEYNPQELFLRGELQISGDPILAMYMNKFFQSAL